MHVATQWVVHCPKTVKDRARQKDKYDQNDRSDIGVPVERNHDAADSLQRKPSPQGDHRHWDAHCTHAIGMLFGLGGCIDRQSANEQGCDHQLGNDLQRGMVFIKHGIRSALQ